MEMCRCGDVEIWRYGEFTECEGHENMEDIENIETEENIEKMEGIKNIENVAEYDNREILIDEDIENM